MTQTMIVWLTTVALLLFVLLLRMIERFRKTEHLGKQPLPLVELEKEATLIYCPGDIADDEESDDL